MLYSLRGRLVINVLYFTMTLLQSCGFLYLYIINLSIFEACRLLQFDYWLYYNDSFCAVDEFIIFISAFCNCIAGMLVTNDEYIFLYCRTRFAVWFLKEDLIKTVSIKWLTVWLWSRSVMRFLQQRLRSSICISVLNCNKEKHSLVTIHTVFIL